MLREYLSAEHRDDPGNGCIMAALATDFQMQPKLAPWSRVTVGA